MNVRDIRVIEGRQHLRFTLEPREPVGSVIDYALTAMDSRMAPRIPIPVEDMLQRLHLPKASQGLPAGLRTAEPPGRLLQDFSSIAKSLEWRMARSYWSSAGLFPFVDNEVPFLINNDGRLSSRAAGVFFAHCAEAALLPPRFAVLELGSGTGLFARFFLDALQQRCDQSARDFYSRLTYIVTDRSRRTVEQWGERNVFSRHQSQVVAAVFDPTTMRAPVTLEGVAVDVPVRATFCNYVLDVLPSTIIRKAENGAEEMRVRTYLASEPSLLAQYTDRSYEQIQDAIAADQESDLASLSEIMPLLEFETRFQRLEADEVPYLAEALDWGEGVERILVNYGAYDALKMLFDGMDAEGFVLINDYGPVKREEVPQQSVSQRFGPTLAFGINFPLLESHWSSHGGIILTPDGDEGRGLHARLLARTGLQQTAAVFLDVFSAPSQSHMETTVEQARAHVSAGRWNDALETYREALTRNPPCWHLIGEAAEFVSLQLRSFDAGLEMIRAAVELNPCYSAWLWNVLGDTLYCLERYQDAHEAYVQAARIDPDDARTNLNLAYTHLHFHRHREALDAVAMGLLHDRYGLYRTRLLEKQQGVLSTLSARRESDLDRAMRRVLRFQ
jgi:tetratricopeptide (TPR) repeat protein